MIQPFLSKIFSKFSRIDGLIRIGVDRALPSNLTVRYVAALIAVAALAISGQIIIQISLVQQTEDQRWLRLIERQVHDSENLRKAILSLQLSSKDSQIKIQTELVQSLALELQKNDEILQSEGITTVTSKPPKEDHGALFEKIIHISTSLASLQDHTTNSTVSELLNLESTYRTDLIQISRYYELTLDHQIRQFKHIELFLLIITLLVLAFEALYVFRPGVESLYAALRIRSDFLGRMGHEMRNPMNSILGMTHLLSETPLTDQQEKYLSILKKSSSGLLEVLNNLLDFSSLESGVIKIEKIPFDFYKFLERAIDLAVYGAHAHGLELVLDLGVDVPLKLVGDPVRIQQILTNLLGNAVKFTQKGEVTLKIQLQKRTEDAWIQFSVIDTGMGIDKDKVNKIFDAFVQEDSTVRRRFGGTGLGLTISKDLVTVLGGTLAVESQKNIGSRFYFTLPLAVTENTTVGDTIEKLNLRNFDAWVAEPNDAVAETLNQLITKCGGNITRVQSHSLLSEVLLKTETDKEKKEIAIIDYDFAKEILPPFFSRIRRGNLNLDAFIFLIKTTTSSNDIEKLAEYGIKSFIFKPLKPIQLLEAISQAICSFEVAQPKLIREQRQSNSIQKIELTQDTRPLRILAVDDSKDNQFLVKAYLKSLPYRLTFADNGRLAVEKFKASQFDLILMDLQMPEMDGYTATQIIREWEKSENMTPTPVIAVSAHDHESISDRFRKAEFSSYLLKPISPHQIRLAILEFTQHLPVLNQSKNSNPTVTVDSSIAEIEKQLADLVPQYILNRKEELDELKRLLHNSSYEKIKSIGHRLKGNAKSYGFEQLGIIGGRLENAAECQDHQSIRGLLVETESYLFEKSQRERENQ